MARSAELRGSCTGVASNPRLASPLVHGRIDAAEPEAPCARWMRSEDVITHRLWAVRSRGVDIPLS